MGYALRASQLDEHDWKRVEDGLRLPFLEMHEPKDFANYLLFYWNAWMELNPSRTRSMGGPSGIPFAAICTWMDERSVLSRDERDRVIRLVQRMDAYYMNWISERMKSEGDSAG